MTSSLFPRARCRWLSGLGVCLLVISGTACSGTPNAKNTMNSTPAPSLVNAWNMQLRPVEAEQVQLTFRPLISSAKKYVGADYRSDGQTLWVTLKSCLVSENCTAMSPARPVKDAADRFTYAVVLPYKGEKVIVQGQGDVREELPLSR